MLMGTLTFHRLGKLQKVVYHHPEGGETVCTLERAEAKWNVVDEDTGKVLLTSSTRKKAVEAYILKCAQDMYYFWSEVFSARPKNPPRESRALTAAQANRVLELLQLHVGALRFELDRQSFLYLQTGRSGNGESGIPTEFRIGGLLGFGGKFWNEAHGFRVSCYREDMGPDTLRILTQTNYDLQDLYREFFPCDSKN